MLVLLVFSLQKKKEYNKRSIFIEKPYTEFGVETIPRPLSKKSKLSHLWINSLMFYKVCFYCVSS